MTHSPGPKLPGQGLDSAASWVLQNLAGLTKCFVFGATMDVPCIFHRLNHNLVGMVLPGEGSMSLWEGLIWDGVCGSASKIAQYSGLADPPYKLQPLACLQSLYSTTHPCFGIHHQPEGLKWDESLLKCECRRLNRMEMWTEFTFSLSLLFLFFFFLFDYILSSFLCK